MEFLDVLMRTPLFYGLQEIEIEKALPCLGARKQLCIKDSTPIKKGDHLPEVGVLISGELNIIKEDLSGETSVEAVLKSGDMFGETLACSSIVEAPYTIYAKQDSYILFLHLTRLLHTCGNACQHHGKILNNLVQILANRNIELESSVDVLSQRTTRDKIMVYLENLYNKQGRNPVSLPMNRGQLAEYISVDRSAMSREFSKLKSEGILSIDRNDITLRKIL